MLPTSQEKNRVEESASVYVWLVYVCEREGELGREKEGERERKRAGERLIQN